jgi:hypothetical protein
MSARRAFLCARWAFTNAFVIVLTFALTGCKIMRVVKAPGATGTVVASDTGEPLRGVRITRYPRKSHVTTDIDGKFVIKPALGFRVFPLIPPAFWGAAFITGRVEIASQDFIPLTIPNHCGFSYLQPVDLGTLGLSPRTL